MKDYEQEIKKQEEKKLKRQLHLNLMARQRELIMIDYIDGKMKFVDIAKKYKLSPSRIGVIISQGLRYRNEQEIKRQNPNLIKHYLGDTRLVNCLRRNLLPSKINGYGNFSELKTDKDEKDVTVSDVANIDVPTLLRFYGISWNSIEYIREALELYKQENNK